MEARCNEIYRCVDHMICLAHVGNWDLKINWNVTRGKMWIVICVPDELFESCRARFRELLPSPSFRSLQLITFKRHSNNQMLKTFADMTPPEYQQDTIMQADKESCKKIFQFVKGYLQVAYEADDLDFTWHISATPTNGDSRDSDETVLAAVQFVVVVPESLEADASEKVLSKLQQPLQTMLNIVSNADNNTTRHTSSLLAQMLP